MPNLTSDLRDPSPPVPGERERLLVATRAQHLGRRRRLAQGAGALAVVAAITVSVAALAGGGSGPSAGRVEAANSGTDATVATTAPAAVGDAPATSGFTLSGAVHNIPAGAIVTLTITGDAGTFTAAVDDAGNFAFSGVPAGTYSATYEWVDSSGTATQAGRLGSFDVANDSTVDFSL
jgi:hypothetical protein